MKIVLNFSAFLGILFYLQRIYALEDIRCLFNSSSLGLCFDCAANYYRESGNINLITPDLCHERIKETKNIQFFVKNTPCLGTENCDGSDVSPFDSLGKAFFEAHKISNKYISSNIMLNLLGEKHYVLRNSLPETTIFLFRRINASVELSPWLCSIKILPGCFYSENDSAIINIKSRSFSIFISKNFTFSRLILEANDIHLINTTSASSINDCDNLDRTCCDPGSLGLDFKISPCGLLNRGLYYKTLGSWGERFGLINLEPILVDISPTLVIKNCSFRNFFPAGNDGGWMALILTPNTGSIILDLLNTSFSDFRFFKGILWVDDYENIFPYITPLVLKALQSYPEEKFNMNIVNCTIERYDSYNLFGFSVASEANILTLKEIKGVVTFDVLQIKRMVNNKELYTLFKIENCDKIVLTTMSLLDMRNFSIMDIKNSTIYLENCSFKNLSFNKGFDAYMSKIFINNATLDTIDKTAFDKNFFKILEGGIQMSYMEIKNNIMMGFQVTNCEFFTFRDSLILNHSIATILNFELINTGLNLRGLTINTVKETGICILFSIKNKDFKGLIHNISDIKINDYSMGSPDSCLFNFETTNFAVDSIVLNGLLVKNSIMRYLFYCTSQYFINIFNVSITDVTTRGIVIIRATYFLIANLNYLTLIRAIIKDIFIRLSQCSTKCNASIKNFFIQELRVNTDGPIYLGLNEIEIVNGTLIDPYYSTTTDAKFIHISSVSAFISNLRIFFSRWKCATILTVLVDSIALIENVFMFQNPSVQESCLFCSLESGTPIIIKNINLENIYGYDNNSIVSMKNGIISMNHYDHENYLLKNNMDVRLFNISLKNCGRSYYALIGAINVDRVYISNASVISVKVSKSIMGAGISILWATEVGMEFISIANIESERYGAIYLKGVDNSTIFNCSLFNTTSKFAGALGALQLNLLTISYMTIFNSTSKSDGGAFGIRKSKVYLSDLTVQNIFAQGEGGVVYLFEGVLNISRANFSKITSYQGGALYLEFSQGLNIEDLECSDASAELRGAFLVSINVESMILSSITIKNLHSPQATGTIYLKSSFIGSHVFSKIILTSCILKEGSLLFIESDQRISITNLNVSESSGIVIQGFGGGTRKNFLLITNLTAIKNGLSSDFLMSSLIKLSFTSIIITGNSLVAENFFSESIIEIMNSMLFMENTVLRENSNNIIGLSIICLSLIQSQANLSNIDYNRDNFNLGMATFLSSNEGDATINNSTIRNCISGESTCIKFTRGSLVLSNSILLNTKGKYAGAIALISANLIVKNVEFNNAQVFTRPIEDESLATLLISSMANFIWATNMYKNNISILIEDINIKASNPSIPAIFFSQIPQITIRRASFSRFSIELTGIAIVSESSNMHIQQCSFSYLSSLTGSAIRFLNKQPDLNNLLQIYNCSFLKNAANVGGSIVMNGKVFGVFIQNIFEENQALNSTKNSVSGIAGCVYFACLKCQEVNITLRLNRFSKNSADRFAPTVFSEAKIFNESNIFENNYDAINYTSTLSCFPMKKNFSSFIYKEKYYPKITGSIERIIVPGAAFDMNVTLMDYFNQTLTFYQFSRSFLTNPTDTKALISREYLLTQSGVLLFQSIRVNTKPNSKLNLTLNLDFNEEEYFPLIIERNSENNLTVIIESLVRPCLMGELYIYGAESCEICLEGEYSIDDPMTKDFSLQRCKQCPENALCSFGNSIIPKKGYWRASENSSMIVGCIAVEACLGHTGGLENYSRLEEISGKCAEHHSGPLCYKCEKGFSRIVSTSICENCENNPFFNIKLAVAFLFIFVYLYIQIRIISVSSSSTLHTSILLKQLLTHFQQISIISVIDLGWTTDFKSYFAFQSYFTFLSEDIFNFDCFLDKFEGNAFIKSLISSLFLPLILSIILLLLLFLEELINFLRFKIFSLRGLLNDFKICMIMIIYMLYAEIIRKCFSLMNCIQLDNFKNTMALRYSPEIECWSEYHQTLILTYGLPGFLTWGIIYPTILFIIMYINRTIIKEIIISTKEQNFEDPEMNENLKNKGLTIDTQNSTRRISLFSKKGTLIQGDLTLVMRFIYKGYKENYYFWELIIFFKKIILIFIGSFTDFFPTESKATALLVIITLFLLIQIKIEPYDNKLLNFIESLSLITTFLSANIGVLLFSEDFKKISLFLLGLLIFFNILFFICWIYVYVQFKKQSTKKDKSINKKATIKKHK